MEHKNDNHLTNRFPRWIRVSQGSAIVLGLAEGKLDVEPTPLSSVF